MCFVYKSFVCALSMEIKIVRQREYARFEKRSVST